MSKLFDPIMEEEYSLWTQKNLDDLDNKYSFWIFCWTARFFILRLAWFLDLMILELFWAFGC